MDDSAALKLALGLLHVPWRVRLVRTQPLPEGVPLLLRVAAGDDASEEAAAAATGRPREVVKQAATFFIEQVLLSPDADSYRMLGASPAASSSELRQNMALLMRWLHPDIAHKGDPSVFAARIAAAWNDLKTPERRAAYDSKRLAPPTPEGHGRRDSRSRSGRRSSVSGRPRRSLPQMLAFLLLGRPLR
jgi:hypothetical protein